MFEARWSLYFNINFKYLKKKKKKKKDKTWKIPNPMLPIMFLHKKEMGRGWEKDQGHPCLKWFLFSKQICKFIPFI